MIGRDLMCVANKMTVPVAVLSEGAGLLKFQQCWAAQTRWRMSFVEEPPSCNAFPAVRANKEKQHVRLPALRHP
jgi:hypothetical protein